MRQAKIIKAALKQILPFQSQLRQMKRRLVPYEDNSENSNYALEQGIDQLDLLRRSGADLTGVVLELGSGWLPIIPLLFHLAGARKLVLTDVERLMDRNTILKAKDVLFNHLPAIVTILGVPVEDLKERLNHDFTPEYVVPWDCRKHPSHAVDIIISRTVLEHVRPESLSVLMDEFGRVINRGGLMCHTVDNSDHWEHTDKSLSRLNFLRYEDDWFWRLCCINPQAYQNRLRHSDYIALFREKGWRVVAEKGEPDKQSLLDLQTLPLAKPFRSRHHHDLAVLTSTFVLRRDDT